MHGEERVSVREERVEGRLVLRDAVVATFVKPMKTFVPLAISVAGP